DGWCRRTTADGPDEFRSPDRRHRHGIRCDRGGDRRRDVVRERQRLAARNRARRADRRSAEKRRRSLGGAPVAPGCEHRAPRDRGAARGSLSGTDVKAVGYRLIVLALLSVALAVATSAFLTVSNLLNVLRQASLTFLLASGLTLTIVAAGLDLSVG